METSRESADEVRPEIAVPVQAPKRWSKNEVPGAYDVRKWTLNETTDTETECKAKLKEKQKRMAELGEERHSNVDTHGKAEK